MKFSIITVVKNDISKIGLTIKSLKNQLFKDYEHIILDGKSTDETSEFLKKISNKKTLYFREKDKSVYDALNKSFKKAKGEYFIVLHSGDFFYSKDSLINIGTGHDKSILEYAKFILKKINYKCMIILDKSKPDGTKRKIIDNSIALSYGWKPKINLDDGFELTLKSYFSNSNK
ncbi:glycosyltransferase [Candidatus Pelagibacter sp.]|nr:glycosyltransferase [Candidatus Pelagibacter sp.]